MRTLKTIEEFCERYNEISDHCHQTGQPVYVTRDNSIDLVAIDLGSYNHIQEQLHSLYENAVSLQ